MNGSAGLSTVEAPGQQYNYRNDIYIGPYQLNDCRNIHSIMFLLKLSSNVSYCTNNTFYLSYCLHLDYMIVIKKILQDLPIAFD